MNVKNTTILLYKDVEVLDFAGPFEVFNTANSAYGEKLFNVYTVAEHKDILEARNGLKVLPDYSIAMCPQPDILVIPGGDGRKVQMNNEVILNWLKDNYKKAELILSVCTGAFILGKAGLLDGLSAATHHLSHSEFEKTFPNVNLIKERKYVDNGNIITSGGISAGIDMALYVVGKLAGEDTLNKTAHYMEFAKNE